MRQDQFQRMQELSEKLAEVFLEEGDSDMWPGAGASIADVDQQTRGDRYWCKKNAMSTLAIIIRIQTLTNPQNIKQPDDEVDPGLDAEIKSAEKAAAKLMSQLQSGNKVDRMKRQHGKA